MATETFSFLIGEDLSGRYPALQDAVQSLISSRFSQGRFLIEMPLIMPSGSVATVTVWPEGLGETFMVTDDGASHFEVTSGVFNEALFSRIAKDRCVRYGAIFDGNSMFFFFEFLLIGLGARLSPWRTL